MKTNLRFIWGSLLLALGIGVAVIGLVDLGVFLLFGSASTLSQYLADSVDQSAGVLLATNGLSFTAGMLATHFTNFRMTPQGANRKPTQGRNGAESQMESQ